ncbi:MAG TPA: hypothetical protein VIQ02_16580 [Jiangellaceae bacterium]
MAVLTSSARSRPGFRVRRPDLTMVSGLLPAAAGVALMAFVESMAAAGAFTAKGEQDG